MVLLDLLESIGVGDHVEVSTGAPCCSDRIMSFALIIGLLAAARGNTGDQRLEEPGWDCSQDGTARAGLGWQH